MLAGILTTGSQPDPVPWEDLRQSVEHVRATGGGGHVWWFSRGVLDVYPNELSAFYGVESSGQAPHPMRPADWRRAPIVIEGRKDAQARVFSLKDVPPGRYHVLQHNPALPGQYNMRSMDVREGAGEIRLPGDVERIELLVDRRPAMMRYPPSP
jgi:hypothetical protein